MSVTLYASAATAAGPVARKGPYLQQLGPTGVEVRVELDAASSVSVDVAKEGDTATKTFSDAAQSTFHAVRIDGLEPATKYGYAVHFGAGSEKGSFTTAPKPDSGAPFTFLLYGDNRSGDEVHRLVTRAMQGTPSDFLLHTGDFAYAGGDEREWQTLFDIEKALLKDRCVFSSVGNHELNGDPAAAAYEKYLGPSAGKLYGTFRWSNTRFFLLNAFTSWQGGEEREWLTKELEKADSEPGLAWRIAVIHHGPFSSGRHGPNADIDAARIPELLSKHKVDLVVSGHDHIYERGEATSSAYDVRYLISGGSGAPLYDEHTARAYAKRFLPVYNFVQFDVTGDHVDVVARRPDGSTIEKCGFGHEPGWDCDAPTVQPAAPPKSSAPSPAHLAANASPAETKSCGCSVVGGGARGFGALLVAAALALAMRAGRRRAD